MAKLGKECDARLYFEKSIRGINTTNLQTQVAPFTNMV